MNMPTTYRNDDGRTLSFFQIAKLGVLEGAEVEQTEEGFIVDGDVYEPVRDEGETDDGQ